MDADNSGAIFLDQSGFLEQPGDLLIPGVGGGPAGQDVFEKKAFGQGTRIEQLHPVVENFHGGVSTGSVVAMHDHVDHDLSNRLQGVFPNLGALGLVADQVALADVLPDKSHTGIDLGKKIIPNGQSVPNNGLRIESPGVNGADQARLPAKEQEASKCYPTFSKQFEFAQNGQRIIRDGMVPQRVGHSNEGVDFVQGNVFQVMSRINGEIPTQIQRLQVLVGDLAQCHEMIGVVLSDKVFSLETDGLDGMAEYGKLDDGLACHLEHVHVGDDGWGRRPFQLVDPLLNTLPGGFHPLDPPFVVHTDQNRAPLGVGERAQGLHDLAAKGELVFQCLGLARLDQGVDSLHLINHTVFGRKIP